MRHPPVDGLVAQAREHINEITPGSPRRDDNHHRKEAKAMLDRAEKLAKRLPGKAQEAALNIIRSLRGQL